MSDASPARLLDAPIEEHARERARRVRRGPVVVTAVVAALMLTGALFVQTASHRAAHLTARSQADTFAELATRTTLADDSALPSTLAKMLATHEASGLRYVGVLRGGAVIAEAGHAKGRAVATGTSERAGERLRVVVPLATPTSFVFEIETIAANDAAMAGNIGVIVAIVLGAVIIALGLRYARALATHEAMAAKLEAERRLAALGEMSAVLAHELRNPLTALKGHAQLLRAALPDGAQKNKAERVVNETLRLEHLTDDLLELVRIGQVQRRPTDVSAVITRAVELADGPRFELTAPNDLAPCALDAERLALAIANLLRNAAHASSGKPIAIDLAQTNDHVTVAVRDRGPGIPADQLEDIFLPFRTDKLHGTGLGLAIAKRIVELHGGTIAASNHPEGGAVFRIQVPRT